MTAPSDLEIKGNFLTYPLAELLAEIAAAGLSGSLRVSGDTHKGVIYFKDGRIVFAASNARSSRLFDILLQRKTLNREQLASIPDFQNDFELAARLEEKTLATKSEIEELFIEQITAILVDVLSWRSGEWTFSHLARARAGLEFDVDATKLLIEYARCLTVNDLVSRLSSIDETFVRTRASEGVGLTPDETLVLSLDEGGMVTLADACRNGAISETGALRALYALWLCGLFVRTDRVPAFSPEKVSAMRSARLEIKREAKLPTVVEAVAANGASADETKPEREPEIELSVDAYLKQVENAETFYDVLGVDPKAKIPELKKAYFALARKFHPDRYHAQGGETLKRIQKAFTGLAQAHETLKNQESRDIYDYRIRKELTDREQAREAGDTSENASLQFTQASESFEHGYTLLMDGEPEAATPFLARAAHYAPKNARYRAYYGKALSADDTKRHKAEAEMQAALKIDPNNPTYRVFLAEFFIHNKLLKRAEGELNRLLAVHPNNREAQDLLSGLKAR